MATTLLFTTALLLIAAVAGAEKSVHDLLPTYGFPRGLIPNIVKSYTLNDDGHFVVELTATCYVYFTDLTYYDKIIKGKISYGSITDLEGIQVKKLFAWLPVTGLKADDPDDGDKGNIEFMVGFLSEKLPVAVFEEIPVCRTRAGFGRGFFPQQILPAVDPEV